MKRFNYLLVLLLATAFISACSREDGGNAGGGAASSDGPTIAAILLQEDQFYRLNEAGMKAAAEEHGVNLLVSNTYGKIDREMQLVETYIAKGVDAILAPPISQTGTAPALKKAHDAGIKVIIYDTILDADFPDCKISSDQNGLGAMTGKEVREYIEEKLDGKANIAIIQYVAMSLELGPLRPAGFESQIKDMPGVKIVAKQDAWIAHKATEVVETLIGAHPEINIIWSANEGGTVGSVTAVRNAGKAGKIAVFGTDISEQLASMLLADDNVLQAVTAQKPFEMGYTALTSAVKVLKGEPIEKSKTLSGTLFSRKKPEEVKAIKDKLSKLAG